MRHTIEFETTDDWNPMREPTCWSECPFSILIGLGQTCKARDIYEKRGEIICPVIRLKVKER